MSASLEQGLSAFRNMIDSEVASFFSSCVHCGLCAEACLFYTETGDPKFTPIHKLEPFKRTWQQEFTLGGKILKWAGLSKPVTDEELEEWSELVYDSCTLCNRCSMVCPVGNDITDMIRRMREGMAVSGHAPENIVAATKRAVNIGSPMGVKLPALQAQIRHVEQETGLTVPVDKEGVDYMLLLSSMEIINFPEYISAITRIFDQANVSWTLSSDAFEATNSGIQLGVSDIAKKLVMRNVDAAEKLRVKTLVTPECGHAYFAMRWEGPNLIGRPYSFKVIQILELLDELRHKGLLQTEGMEEEPMTFHDPCQIIRRSGLQQEPRNLLNMVASNFHEMEDHGLMNWCCGGGGGVSAIERAEPLRVKGFNKKRQQIEQTGCNTLVTSCANCRIVLEEGLEHYDMDVEVISLTELVADHLKPKSKA